MENPVIWGCTHRIILLAVGGRRILWDVAPWIGLSDVLRVVLDVLWVVLEVVLLKAVIRLRFLSLVLRYSDGDQIGLYDPPPPQGSECKDYRNEDH